MAKVSFVRPPAASNSEELWGGGPPPAGDFWCFLNDFIRDLGRLMNLTDTMEKYSIDAVQWEFLTSRSPWFVNAVNQVMEIKRMDAMLVARQRAIGHKVTDGEGNVVVDADGVPVRKGFDAGMARFFIEMDERQRMVQLPDASIADFPPLLPSNVAAHRQMQLNSLHRAQLALQPQVDAGDRQAIDTLIKLQDQVSKLQGTHAAVKKEISYHADGSPNLARLSDDELLAIVADGITLVQQSDGTYVASPNGDE